MEITNNDNMQLIPPQKLIYNVAAYDMAKKLIEELTAHCDDHPQIASASKNLLQVAENYVYACSYKPPLIKPTPKQRRSFTADEFYDVTKDLANTPPSKWTKEQILYAIERMREVQCFFMRGSISTEATKALLDFLPVWDKFVSSRPDVKQLLDPEVILFDVPWIPPNGWQESINRANGSIPAIATLEGLHINPLPPGSPQGSPPLPAPAQHLAQPGPITSQQMFQSNGTANNAQFFGGFMLGSHYNSVRGFWYLNSNNPPLYF